MTKRHHTISFHDEDGNPGWVLTVDDDGESREMCATCDVPMDAVDPSATDAELIAEAREFLGGLANHVIKIERG